MKDQTNQSSKNTKKTGPLQNTATPKIDEGPYYRPNSPERTRLFEAGIPGDRLTLTGIVTDIRGKPLTHAWLDFWQANGHGEYDNSGYTLRGHQYTDELGKYILETVIPGAYTSRTPHIHVKVRATDAGPILTTQLFIPGLISNKTDFLYRDDLQMDMKDSPKGKAATFNFTLSE